MNANNVTHRTTRTQCTHLVLGQVARGALHVALPHEEQQVVAVDRLLLLEQKVAHKQICPICCSL